MISSCIPVKTPVEIRRIAQTSRILSQIFEELTTVIHPGISPRRIENYVLKRIHAHGASPVLREGFPASCCISVNEVVTHGIPTDVPLVVQDVLTVDVSIQLGGWLSDAAWTYSVTDDAENTELIAAAWQVVTAGIQILREGVGLQEIAETIEKKARECGVQVFCNFCGHGIGKKLHEPPMIYHCWNSHTINTQLQGGMVITIEPIVTFGAAEICELEDGWGFRSQDNRKSAQFEHTVVIDDFGSRVLTMNGISGVDMPSYHDLLSLR